MFGPPKEIYAGEDAVAGMSGYANFLPRSDLKKLTINSEIVCFFLPSFLPSFHALVVII